MDVHPGPVSHSCSVQFVLFNRYPVHRPVREPTHAPLAPRQFDDIRVPPRINNPRVDKPDAIFRPFDVLKESEAVADQNTRHTSQAIVVRCIANHGINLGDGHSGCEIAAVGNGRQGHLCASGAVGAAAYQPRAHPIERRRLNDLGFAPRLRLQQGVAVARESHSGLADGAMAMLLASETPAMEAYRVSRAVNTPRGNAEALLHPVTPLRNA